MIWRPFSADFALEQAGPGAKAFMEQVSNVESALEAAAGRRSEHLKGSLVLAIQMILDMNVPEKDQHPYITFLPREVADPNPSPNPTLIVNCKL